MMIIIIVNYESTDAPHLSPMALPSMHPYRTTITTLSCSVRRASRMSIIQNTTLSTAGEPVGY